MCPNLPYPQPGVTKMAEEKLEVWLRGPLGGVPDELQPIAHSLLQTLEEVTALVQDLPDDLLWTRPGGVASAGFHLRHMAGVIDRLFTYARGDQLDEHQRLALRAEQETPAGPVTAAELLTALEIQIDGAMQVLRSTSPEVLSEKRGVGRKGLPSTVRGLYFHVAEHLQRHLGQLLVTVRVQRANREGGAPGQG